MNGRRWSRFATLCILLSGLASLAMAAYNEPPHNLSNPYPVGCLSCHDPHGGSEGYPSILQYLCDSCHYDGGPAPDAKTHSSRTTDTGYGNWDLDCWTCHNPHTQEQDNAWGTSYGKYIRKSLAPPCSPTPCTPDRTGAEIKEIDPNDPGPYYAPLSILRTVVSDIVRFTSQAEFVDGDATAGDDICQVCHASTQYYEQGSALNSHADYGPDSQPGGNCTTCHTHVGGFSATGGCVNCHDQAQPEPPAPDQYRRQVTGAGGDFERASHHVTDGTTTEIVTDEDCAVCHDQSNHLSNTDPAVLLNNPDAGTGHAYDGTGSSIEGFCLDCHDSDGATAYGGSTPFSDGNTPPDIASTWSTSSHSALANEACLACHGGTDSTRTETVTDHNVHGSTSAKLLSTLVAGETVANLEEGLCFACHDGSPAATDIEAMFAGTATYADSSGALINSHHDISDGDQSYSGAVIECGDCHIGPHAATSSDYLLADPDPNDGVTPSPGSRWSGSTWLSEWCLDCHDNSYPSSVTPPTNPLVDMDGAWVLSGGGDKADQHGMEDASRNVILRPGSGYSRFDVLECTTCHNPGHGDDESGTVYPNLFNLRSVIYSKDGLTKLVPDDFGDGYFDPTDNTVVRLTDATSGNADSRTNGRQWCSACHPDPMGGNKTAGCLDGNCHHHGTSSY